MFQMCIFIYTLLYEQLDWFRPNLKLVLKNIVQGWQVCNCLNSITSDYTGYTKECMFTSRTKREEQLFVYQADSLYEFVLRAVNV